MSSYHRSRRFSYDNKIQRRYLESADTICRFAHHHFDFLQQESGKASLDDESRRLQALANEMLGAMDAIHERMRGILPQQDGPRIDAN